MIWSSTAGRALRRLAPVALIPVLAMSLVACDDDGGDEAVIEATQGADETQTASPTEVGTSLDDAEPGTVVQVSGDLQRVIGPHTLVIDGGGVLGIDGLLESDLLVLVPPDVSFPDGLSVGEEDGQVEVEGEVVDFNFLTVGDELGEALGSNEESELDGFDDERAVLARSIAYVNNEVGLSDLDEAAVGETVTLCGDVQQVVSDRLFIVGGDEVLGLFGGSDVPVFLGPDSALSGDVAEGDVAQVVGQVIDVQTGDLATRFDEPFTDDELSALDDDDKGLWAESVTIVSE
ncbi:MAG: hypothetical protein R3C39_07260 [Dehalococcoidia bacterium]